MNIWPIFYFIGTLVMGFMCMSLKANVGLSGWPFWTLAIGAVAPWFGLFAYTSKPK